jgi:hypothetical protein
MLSNVIVVEPRLPVCLALSGGGGHQGSYSKKAHGNDETGNLAHFWN